MLILMSVSRNGSWPGLSDMSVRSIVNFTVGCTVLINEVEAFGEVAWIVRPHTETVIYVYTYLMHVYAGLVTVGR